MSKTLLILVITFLARSCQTSLPNQAFTYPDVKRNDTVCDDYFGNKICDPYRWLENPDPSELKTFIEEQNKLTESYINASSDGGTIKRLLEDMAKHETFNCPIKAGGKYYYSRNTGVQDQDVFYVQDSLNSEPRQFLDPNELSKNGTASVYGTYFSHGGAILAYEVQNGGSDWITLHFKRTTGQDLPDKLDFLKFTYVEWKKDDSGVYYARYPSNGGLLEHQKIYFHKLGTNQNEDILLVEFPENKQWFVGFFSLSHDGNYLVVVPADGIGVHTIYYADLNIDTGNNTLTLNPVVTEFTASFEYITNSGNIFYFKTDKEAPNRKIVAIDVTRPEESWITVVDEHPDDTLDSVTVINEKYLVLNYIKNISNVLQLHDLSNGNFIKHLAIEDSGTASLCKIGDRKDTELFFTHTSYLTPKRIYLTNITDTDDLLAEVKIWKEPKLESFDSEEYISKLVFYDSYDGTRIPMFISHRKNLVLNGKLPTKLHAYGGYGVSTLPSFSWENAVFMKNFSGVLAVANIRGGGEYGKRWWDGGRLLNKQNGFNDFQAAAEYLIRQKYTNPSKMYIQGESNGGLMVAACLNQRPDLFGAVIADVGVMDMLRFQRFTIGHAWCSEFGCSDEEIHFNNLVQYSPLHNIRMPTNGVSQYPPVLVLTADNDDRVLPLHSYKYISEMQHTIGKNPKQTNPLLLRVEADAGHGLVGKPITKQIEESRDVFVFLMQSLGYELDSNSDSASTKPKASFLVIMLLSVLYTTQIFR